MAKGLTYGFDASTTDPNLDLTLFVKNAVGGNVASGSAANGATVSVSYSATLTGMHFVQVQDSSNNDTGDYTLTINANDTIVNSIDTTEVLTGGDTLNSAIDVIGDIDVIKTELTQGLTYGFVVSTNDPDIDFFVLVKNAVGGNVASASGANGATVTASYTATQNGSPRVHQQNA